MWKHEILQSLSRQKETGILAALSKSQNFHLGNSGDFYQFAKNAATSSELFKDSDGSVLKIPFPMTLFTHESQYEKIRFATLAYQDSDVLELVVLMHIKERNEWSFFSKMQINRGKYYIAYNDALPNNEDSRVANNTVLTPASLACSALIARNVFLDGIEHPNMEKRNRRRKKKRQPLLERYHVLKFCPGKIVSKDAIGIGTGENSGSMPVHLCRGHFMSFAPDRPMFGRSGLHGRFWVQAHVRGNKKNGVVVKDYELAVE